MEKAIKHHFNKEIIEQERLTGGFTFEMWLLTLSGNEKVVFRTQRDLETAGGRKIIISDVLEREKYFYDSVNKNVGKICPIIYVIDATRNHHENAFCIMEYIDGTPLNKCFDDFNDETKSDISYKIGELAAQINNIETDENHHYIRSRGS